MIVQCNTQQILCKDLRIKFSIFSKEFVYLSSIISYLGEHNNKSITNRYDYKLLTGLKDIITTIKNKENEISNILDLLDKTSYNFDNENESNEFFIAYLKGSFWIDWGVNLMPFLKKKISHTIECLPSYYPAPNVTRSRQEVGVYHLLREYIDYLLNFFSLLIFDQKELLDDDNIKFDSISFWEFLNVNEFNDKIFDTSSKNN